MSSVKRAKYRLYVSLRTAGMEAIKALFVVTNLAGGSLTKKN